MANLKGVVLCGGQSKRMGTDKGLLDVDGTKWAVSIANKLTQQHLEVVVSVNSSQLDSYKALFPTTPLIQDKTPISGPLNGLLSVHEMLPDSDLLLMACDMIDMDATTLTYLIDIYHSEPNYEFYVYEQGGFTQPFCAIYTAKGLAKVYEDLNQGNLVKYSLHDRFESGNTKYLSLKNDKVFTNYNSL